MKITGILKEAFMAGVEAAAAEADAIATRQGELIGRADISELDKECFAHGKNIAASIARNIRENVSPEADGD